MAEAARRGEKKKKAGVAGTLILYLSLFCLITLLVIWGVQVFFLNHIYYNFSLQRMNNAAADLAPMLTQAAPQDLALAIAVRHQVGISVFDVQDGAVGPRILRVQGEAGSTLGRLTQAELNTLYAEARAAGGSLVRQYADVFSLPDPDAEGTRVPDDVRRERLVSVRTLTLENGAQYALFLDTSARPASAMQGPILIEIALISVLLILLSLVLARAFSQRISRPLRHLNDGAKALAAGHYDTPFEGGGCREIDELADTLNYAADELSKVDRLQHELMANVSHDLRTPLTLIIGYGEVMRDIEGENRPENVQLIIDEAKRLSDLVNDLMQISRYRVESHEPPSMQTFDLGEMLRDSVARYARLLSERRVSLEAEIEGSLPVNGDPARLVQVLYNLINNAVNYSPAPAEGEHIFVGVRCRRREDTVRVEVVDRGKGIAPQELESIWQRYYRAEENHRRSVIGSGLGLSIVRGILEAHRARYGVNSRLGEGSCFWFELPLADTAEKTE